MHIAIDVEIGDAAVPVISQPTAGLGFADLASTRSALLAAGRAGSGSIWGGHSALAEAAALGFIAGLRAGGESADITGAPGLTEVEVVGCPFCAAARPDPTSTNTAAPTACLPNISFRSIGNDRDNRGTHSERRSTDRVPRRIMAANSGRSPPVTAAAASLGESHNRSCSVRKETTARRSRRRQKAISATAGPSAA
jgi:hypothetical protein